MRGPWTQPRFTASRSAIVTPSSPRLRTVVKPARSVFMPFIWVSKACSGSSSRTSASSACSPPRSLNQMDVAVDQPGQHRLVAQVDAAARRRSRHMARPSPRRFGRCRRRWSRARAAPCPGRRSAGRHGCRLERRWRRRRRETSAAAMNRRRSMCGTLGPPLASATAARHSVVAPSHSSCSWRASASALVACTTLSLCSGGP